ncbi:MAG: hypothetical protein H6739_35515 [Alphaproteobacteria bacterium]|nr:hypothetical protein [Alphaproteobacteria bacterium]
MTGHQAALQELDRYARMCVRHSYDQYARHGTLHSKAEKAFEDPNVWKHKWVPDDFDIGEARNHPVFQHSFSPEQQLAWNHLQWGMEYTVVAQGERQIIVLNNYAVRQYKDVLPSIVDLEHRESYEEVDHIQAFEVVLEGLRSRYFPHKAGALWSKPASGFGSNRLNSVVRHTIGVAAEKMLGANFPVLFFLTRGLKTHNFKPFENAIATFDDGHEGMKMISHLHRLDESRHMATALYIARLSTEVLDTLPRESQFLFKMAVKAAFPANRQADYRLSYWKTVLDEAVIFQDIPRAERDALFDHITTRTHANLTHLHDRQTHLTRQANKRIIEECALSPEFKRLFVAQMRKDPVYKNLVDAVELPN